MTWPVGFSLLHVARSGAPSRSKSPTTRSSGVDPAGERIGVGGVPKPRVPLLSTTETLPVAPGIVVARSRVPFLSKSATTRDWGFAPPAPKVAAGVNPPTESFSKIEMVPSPEFTTARSRSPSPSKSAFTTPRGSGPVGMAGALAKPGGRARSTTMLSASLQGMARSSSPSESASTGAIEEGRVRTGKDASVPKVPSPFPGKQAEGSGCW